MDEIVAHDEVDVEYLRYAGFDGSKEVQNRSSGWIWLFSSTHNTIAISDGAMFSPMMSRTFSTSGQWRV